MTTEESPLLPAQPSNEHELVYQRFSPFHKKVIVAIVFWCALLPPLILGTFYPSLPQIARDLDTTGENVSYSVSIAVLTSSIGALVTSSYSTVYGRRPVYLLSLPLAAISSVGVARAQNMSQLLFWRVWQCAGASPGTVIGAGVIGDIYKLEERGAGMGWFLGGSLIGFALAPPVGGFVAHYSSWRFTQLCLGGATLLSFICVYLIFPETCQSGTRGSEKLKPTENTRRGWMHVNPLRPFTFLRCPTLVAVSIAGFCVLVSDFVLQVPLAYTLGNRYHLDNNQALIGACFLPCGLGYLFGATTSGKVSDRIIIHWRQKRNLWYPEDRLRAGFLGALVFAPLSVLGCGLVTEYMEGPIGLTLNLILLFFNGLGGFLVLSPISAYVVDIIHANSAEAMACSVGVRRLLMSFATAAVMPSINRYGLVATNTISALLSWLGYLLLLLTVMYGERMRSWTKFEYSITQNN